MAAAKQTSDSGEHPGKVRIDKWLWVARFFKTRALASDAIEGGKVEINDERPKRSKLVSAGDRIRIRVGPYEHRVTVLGVSEKRGSATIASALFEEDAESRKAREAMALHVRAMHASNSYEAGRPSKKDRRDIGRVRGR